ncbi:cell division protein FtsZ [Bacteroidetes/Chlorobi group bacterium Naka2016]|jgi:cell division protein FtsZ|nr:MAG: cell division protein FtsZ [Bacteroidetes/Chlorobi group bacterium Naka2016]
MIELDNSFEEITKISVVGVGGAGCNAIQNLINFGIDSVDLIAINTDAKQLRVNSAPIKLIIGKTKTRGQGAGSNPEIGRQAAEEDYQNIVELLKNKDMVFITAGMGGGTGTGASPLVAKAAKENGALVVGIVVTPLNNEGIERWENAFKGIENLRKHLDGLIIISNEKLSRVSKEQNLPVMKAFQYADRVVYDATKGIIDLINSVGVINVDFADVRTVIQGKGDALIGKGVGEGEQRALMAVESALNSPLLEGIDLRNAQSALVNITFGEDFYHYEVDLILNKIREATNSNLNIIHGLVEDNSMGSSVAVTVVITGFTNSFLKEYEEKKKISVKKEKMQIKEDEFVKNDAEVKIAFEHTLNYKTPKVPEIDELSDDLTTPALLREEYKKVKTIEVNIPPNGHQPYIVRHNEIETEQNEKDGIILNQNQSKTPFLSRLMD